MSQKGNLDVPAEASREDSILFVAEKPGADVFSHGKTRCSLPKGNTQMLFKCYHTIAHGPKGVTGPQVPWVFTMLWLYFSKLSREVIPGICSLNYMTGL
jgi:hypothetical protein